MSKKDEVLIYNNPNSSIPNTFITRGGKPRKIETKVIKYEGDGNVLRVSSMTHMSLPFFTKRKQGRGVNFVYDIGFLGLTMKCSLSSDAELNIQQPGEFEEKVYDYLIQTLYYLYKKNDIKDIKNFVRDTAIEFEVKELVESLGLKQSNSYADKVSKALANLKNTTYSFHRKNVAKSSKKILEFEHEKFSLINYERASIGRKHHYKVRLDNPIAIEAFEKNLIMHFTDHSIKRLSEKSNIPERIYKFIAMNRFNRDKDEVSVVELACVVPYELGGVHIVKGKSYSRDRTKEVISKLSKNFDLMIKTGYLEKYEVIDNEKFRYTFCNEKLGLVTNHTLEKHYKVAKALEVKKPNKIVNNTIKTEDIIVVEDTKLTLKKAISKCKRNIFASKSWNKRVENKIAKIAAEDGEEYAIKILGAVYHNLNAEVTKTLVQYINGIIKNTPKGEHPVLKKTKETLIKKNVNKVQVDESLNPEILIEERTSKTMKNIVKSKGAKSKKKDDIQEAEIVDSNESKVIGASEGINETETTVFKAMYGGAVSIIEATKQNPEKDILLKTVKRMKTVSTLSEFLKNL